jgi:hypothetical protein
MRRLLAPAALSGLAALLAPVAAQAETDEAVWVNATVQGSIKDRLVYFAEVQPRINDGASELRQLLLRPAIGTKLSDAVTVYQGYARVIDYREIGDQKENRSFQQITWNVAKGSFGELQSRTRIEERFVEGSGEVGIRLRHMARWELPLEKKARPIGALAWAEGFVALNDTDWGARAGVDQVRLFGGAEIPLFGKSTLEAGYMAQITDLPAGRSRVRHIASLTFQLRY